MTYLGAPVIYYSDEAGMWGANDPDCRKPMVWDDLNYDDKKTLPDQSKKDKADKVELNREIFDHYKKIIRIRNNYAALQTGSFKTTLINNNKNVYASARRLGKQFIIVTINNSNFNRKIKLNLNRNDLFYDALNNLTVKSNRKKLSINVKAKWGRIFVRQ